MKPVPHDGKTMGEIMIRGNIVMKGYYKDKEATEKAMKGGWFHSGDLAVTHPDGYITPCLALISFFLSFSKLFHSSFHAH